VRQFGNSCHQVATGSNSLHERADGVFEREGRGSLVAVSGLGERKCKWGRSARGLGNGT